MLPLNFFLFVFVPFFVSVLCFIFYIFFGIVISTIATSTPVAPFLLFKMITKLTVSPLKVTTIAISIGQ